MICGGGGCAVVGDNFCAYCAEQGIYLVGVERLRVLLFGDWVFCWLCGDCLANLDQDPLFAAPPVVLESERLFTIKGGLNV